MITVGLLMLLALLAVREALTASLTATVADLLWLADIRRQEARYGCPRCGAVAAMG